MNRPVPKTLAAGRILAGLFLAATVLLAGCMNTGETGNRLAATVPAETIPASANPGILPTEADLSPTATALSTPINPTESQAGTLASPTASPNPPTPSPTPAAVLRQLTTGGCCTEPSFSPDGQLVVYIDKPGPEAPSGLWGVPAHGCAAPDCQPQLALDRLGAFSNDLAYRAFPANGVTVIERLADGTRWPVANGQRPVVFSPDNTSIAWTAGQTGPPYDTPVREVWVGPLDGIGAEPFLRLFGGGVQGWLPDGRLLVSGRRDPQATESALWAFRPDASIPGRGDETPRGELVELARGSRLRSPSVSPDGSWLLYGVTFDQDSSRNGLWAQAIDRPDPPVEIESFGSYGWRDGNRLLIVPLEPGQPHRLLQATLPKQAGEPVQVEAITDPAVTPFKIANGDWAVSPDGSAIVFVSADDNNLWLLELPE